MVANNPDEQAICAQYLRHNCGGSADNTIKLWNGNNGWDLDALMGRSCDWVRAYLQNNINVREEDRHLCDGIGGKSSVSGF